MTATTNDEEESGRLTAEDKEQFDELSKAGEVVIVIVCEW
eukprot:CAMPEP_0172320186 /NCGR_PEP_ID=MMETSP1058-20130122/39882_1 /TAXON_ID=83371 /ORGANISM="Detonula confervacea, Strain CCMP 353" /LENGTH=39 /DNA_ID= /DNA_START= /DNA_END= /DNA_ORIENTATION=